MVYITEIHMSPGGTQHEHIEKVLWKDTGNGDTSEATVAQMVDYIERGNSVYVEGPPAVQVGVWTSSNGRKYIRTYSDGTWNNNLLSLPRY